MRNTSPHPAPRSPVAPVQRRQRVRESILHDKSIHVDTSILITLRHVCLCLFAMGTGHRASPSAPFVPTKGRLAHLRPTLAKLANAPRRSRRADRQEGGGSLQAQQEHSQSSPFSDHRKRSKAITTKPMTRRDITRGRTQCGKTFGHIGSLNRS